MDIPWKEVRGEKRLKENIDGLIKRRFYKYKKALNLENVRLEIKDEIVDDGVRYPGKLVYFTKNGSETEPLEGACAIVHISRMAARDAYEKCPMLIDYLVLHELRHYRFFLDGKDPKIVDIQESKMLAELQKKAKLGEL